MIPERDFHAADGRQHRRSALVLVADQFADDRLDVAGIDAEDSVLDPFVNQRFDGLLLPLQRRLADARQAGVGGQPNEQVVSQSGVREKRLQL